MKHLGIVLSDKPEYIEEMETMSLDNKNSAISKREWFKRQRTPSTVLWRIGWQNQIDSLLNIVCCFCGNYDPKLLNTHLLQVAIL